MPALSPTTTKAGVLIAKRADETLFKCSDPSLGAQRGLFQQIRGFRGFKDTIKGHGSYEIISELETKGQTEIAMPAVRKFLKSGECRYTSCPKMTRSAIGAFSSDQGARNHPSHCDLWDRWLTRYESLAALDR